MTEKYNVAGLLQKSSEKTGFLRERFDGKNIPTDPSRITVVPFFGDLRSLVVLSTILLKRFREEDRGSRYFILCSYPGFQSLFPYVDEYWGITDVNALKKLYAEASEFDNKSDLASIFYRNLNHHFFEDVVIPADTLKIYYQRGITNDFWTKYRHVKVSLPLVPSSALLGRDFNRQLNEKGGYKIFVHPSRQIQVWQQGRVGHLLTDKKFWMVLIETLIKKKMVPVIWKSFMSYDLSPELTTDCIHLSEADIGKVLAAMRSCNCVLDVFNSLSRLAIMARTPFLSVDERHRYMTLKDFEIDDLCGKKVPMHYIFSFATILEEEGWDATILENIILRLDEFLPELNRDLWPSTGESTEIVAYDTVRKNKAKKIGVKLLKISKD